MITKSKNASSKAFEKLFHTLFPYRVKVRDDVDTQECVQWLAGRTLAEISEDKTNLTLYSWLNLRECGFMDARTAMEFKLTFG